MVATRFETIDSEPAVADSTWKVGILRPTDSPSTVSLATLKTFMSASPTLVTPALGTPASGNISNCTGGPTLTSATLITPALGTPASGNLQNCTLTHTQIPVPKVSYKSWAVTAANLVDGGAAVGTYTLPSTGIPAGAILLGSMVVVTAGFAGDVSATLKIGDGTDDDRYMTGTPSIFAAAATGIQTGVPSGDKLILTVNSPVVTVTSASDITPVLAGGGSMTISIYYIQTA